MRMGTTEMHFLKLGMSASNFVHVLLTVWLENCRYKIIFFQNLEKKLLDDLLASIQQWFYLFLFCFLIYLNDMINIYTWIL